MVAGVEKSVESDRSGRTRGEGPLDVQLLGPWRSAGTASRWRCRHRARCVRCIAYLSVAPHAVSRSQLCELLWDVPNDPRGELRWCLSKLRSVLDEPGRRRVETRGDTVKLDLGGLLRRCDRDRPSHPGGHRDACARAAARAVRAVRRRVSRRPARSIATPSFNGWLTAQRRRFRSCHAALLEHLAEDGDRRRGVRISGEMARACAVRPARPRASSERVRPTRPDSRGRGAPGGDGPAVRGGGPRHRAHPRTAWRAARAQGDGAPKARAAAPAPTVAVAWRRRGERARVRPAVPPSP